MELDKEGLDIFNNAVFNNGVNEFEANLEGYIRMVQLNATLRKAKYDALLLAGFSEEQALTIILGTQILQ